MNKYRLVFSSLALFTFFLLSTFAAQAQPQRTFVSTSGSDSNPCSRSLPCRNFTAGVTAVAAGGEVVALDSGGYGPVTITKAVTLTAPTGVYVAITAQTGSAVVVSAEASDVVVLRGLTLTGLGGSNGIDVTSVGVLHVESCVISGFANAGLNVYDYPAQVYMKDTIARNNNNHGVFLRNRSNTSDFVRASIDRCRFEKNGFAGVVASTRAKAVVRDSVASGNGTTLEGHGMIASSPFGDGPGSSGIELSIENSVMSYNATYGVSADCFGGAAGSVVRLSHSTVTNNGTGIRHCNGTFLSRGNNTVSGNGTNTSGTITPLAGT